MRFLISFPAEKMRISLGFSCFCPSSLPVFLKRIYDFVVDFPSYLKCDFWFKCITVTIEMFLVLSTCGCNSRFSPPERPWVEEDGWAGLCRVMGRGGHSCPLYSSSRLSEFTHASISMYSSPTRARFDDLLFIFILTHFIKFVNLIDHFDYSY